ncbi:hypothetical protein AX774_g2749 [Zancudomyces culisetae]|uniref:DUF1764-domain-containing protein n=1 Tax=Zancudomyces culisetae TaxID=1213189 RepID=A0A1R1PRX6_ZANCU|nr:hypothetical protein AX774_g2749 [Zancudomyces culisetae]|eukprot:OMH83735.1 hypothetical protein AX774_g2749 [Zancudomyces culisetae]
MNSAIEIDNIFGSKTKKAGSSKDKSKSISVPDSKTIPAINSSTPAKISKKTKKKNKNKIKKDTEVKSISKDKETDNKNKDTSDLASNAEQESSVIVVDASGHANDSKLDAKKNKQTTNSQKFNDDDGFSDSRGLRNGRKTVDTLRVFYFDELKIGEGEGDTELCPFDCDCCY